MALGPLVFTLMGVLGTVVYLLSSDKRNKKSNKYFFFYLTSIFSIWISFELNEITERGSSVRILLVPFGLFGIYGLLYFGVMLFTSLGDEKGITETNDNKVTESAEYIKEKIDQEKDKISLKSTKIKKYKNWYVVKDKIYDKFESYRGYYFDKSLDGKRYTTFKKNEELFGFTINDVNVDTIEYINGKAIVKCPSCDQKCRCTVIKLAEITCPSCGQNWNQNFDIDLAKASL